MMGKSLVFAGSVWICCAGITGCFGGGGDSGEQGAGALSELMQVAGELAKEAKDQQAAQAQAAANADPDATLFEKIGGYIDCINDTNSVSMARDRYLEWVNPKKGLTCKERNIDWGIYEVDAEAVGVCNRAVEKGKTLQPSMPGAEAAAAELATIFAELAPLNNKFETYLEQNDFKDDDCAFGKEAHPKLIDLYDRYHTAASKLKAEVDKVKNDADLRQLAHLEKVEGRKYAWQVKRMMIYAKRIVDIYPDGAEPQSVKGEAYLGPFGEFEPLYKEFDAYAKASSAEIDDIMFGSSFVDACEEFYAAAKELRRDYDAKKKKLDVEKYNEFIEGYNGLIKSASNISWD